MMEKKLKNGILVLCLIFCCSLLSSCAVQVNKTDGDEIKDLPYEWMYEGSLYNGAWDQYNCRKDLSDKDHTGVFVYELPGHVFAFAELLQNEEVISFLILGNERALMLDTGMGIFNLRDLAEQLTDLPITVVNSHDHLDHIGGNSQFDDVWCYDIPSAIERLTQGATHEEVMEWFDLDTFAGVFPTGFDKEAYCIPGKRPTGTVKDGQIIDLGDRKLEVMYTPGHSESSIMLFDESNHILFTGDMFYPGPIYLFFEDSSLDDYVSSMDQAVRKAEKMGISYIYCSHNAIIQGIELMRETAEFAKAVSNGEQPYSIEESYGAQTRYYKYDSRIGIVTLDSYKESPLEKS